jgi:hypothetical protein
LKGVDIGISHRLADDVFMNFAAESGGLLGALTAEDVEIFLIRLMALPELEGYWVETFLAAVSAKHAVRLAKFFMDRVDYAAANESWDYRPCNHGPWARATAIQEIARLRASAPAGIRLDEIARRPVV